MRISVELDHEKALAAYTSAGHAFPAIPDNCNTFYRHFDTPEGLPAIIVNQRGHAQMASDNEEQINGCTLIIALDAADNAAAHKTLEQWICDTLEVPRQ